MAKKATEAESYSRIEDLSKGERSDFEIFKQASSRFARCEEWEARFRASFVSDVKFANADPDNGWQWPDDMRNERITAKRPCLTINKTRQHNLQIINDAKQNKPGVKISPTGGGATYEAAKIYSGIVRHIEYKSSAEQIYDMATKFQVEGGIGYFRVATDYINDKSFDQEVLIKPIDDPMSIYLDPDIKEIDGSDARFGFLFDDMPKDEFEIEYPDHADVGALTAIIGDKSKTWITKDHVRVCEYFRKVKEDDELLYFKVPETGKGETARASVLKKLSPEIYKAIIGDKATKKRALTVEKIEWFKIAGDKIIDRGDWAGKYIPIVRVIGEETKIEGKLDRKGHTRSMKDAQRMYNYWTSAGVEFIALQTIAPWVVSAEAVDGYQEFWNAANERRSYLPWNAYTEDGQPLTAPSRPGPPVAAGAYMQGMQVAQNEMMLATGQYQSQFGEAENAKSGVAINARQRQGDRATYHYIDGLGIAIRYLGKILIDLIPKIYDTERVVMIMGDDGKESLIQINPALKSSMKEVQSNEAEGEATIIFNPNVGEYAVQSDIGPSYATRRQEAFNAFTQIASQNDQFMQIAGDIMFRAADFPMADELAERMRRMVPLQALGEAPPPELSMQLDQYKMQVSSMQQTIGQLMESISKKDKDLADRRASTAVAAYQARTQRLGVVANAKPELQNAVLPIAAQTEAEMLGEGESLNMGGNFVVNPNGGEMSMELGSAILETLAALSQGQMMMAKVLTAPKRKTLTTDAQGRPNGSVETIELPPGEE